MYLVEDHFARGPQVGGPSTVWHYHIFPMVRCFHEGVPKAFPQTDGTCHKGIPTNRSPEMLHVWFVDRPEGVFATPMALSAAEITELGAR